MRKATDPTHKMLKLVSSSQIAILSLAEIYIIAFCLEHGLHEKVSLTCLPPVRVMIMYATGKGSSNGGAPLCVRCCWRKHPTQLMKH